LHEQIIYYKFYTPFIVCKLINYIHEIFHEKKICHKIFIKCKFFLKNNRNIITHIYVELLLALKGGTYDEI